MHRSRTELIGLSERLQGKPVLSAFIDTSSADPALRRAWHTEVRNALSNLRASLDQADLGAFDDAANRLETRLRGLRNAQRAPAWAAFVADGEVQHFAQLPDRVPTQVHWHNGPWLVPYARLIKQEVPVVVVLIGGESATLLRYVEGRVTPLRTVKAHQRRGHADHMGNAPRVGYHGGTRGATAHDETQRARLHAHQRLVADTARALATAANERAWIVIAGSRELPGKLRESLGPSYRDRTIVFTDVASKMARVEVAAFAQRGARELRLAQHTREVKRLLENTGAHSHGVVGHAATRDALEHGAAAEVLLTPRFTNDHADEAQRILELAIGERCGVDVVSDATAALLDARGGGVGAVLRFALHATPSPQPVPATTGS